MKTQMAAPWLTEWAAMNRASSSGTSSPPRALLKKAREIGTSDTRKLTEPMNRSVRRPNAYGEHGRSGVAHGAVHA